MKKKFKKQTIQKYKAQMFDIEKNEIAAKSQSSFVKN